LSEYTPPGISNASQFADIWKEGKRRGNCETGSSPRCGELPLRQLPVWVLCVKERIFETRRLAEEQVMLTRGTAGATGVVVALEPVSKMAADITDGRALGGNLRLIDQRANACSPAITW
jgi:hypothetical protein